LKRGRRHAAGTLPSVVTSRTLTSLFEAPIRVRRAPRTGAFTATVKV
jgi:ABC-type hemin transport system ATPase subunit